MTMNQSIELSIPFRKLTAPVEVLNLERRMCRALQRAGMRTVAEVVLMGKPKLRAVKRVGPVTTRLVFEAISGYLGISEEELAQQERFARAHAYGAAAKEGPIYAELAARTGRAAQCLAAADFLNPPQIHSIKRWMEHIDIHVTDDVLVTKIHVTITNEDGVTLEQGSASSIHEGWWMYETEVPGKVLVEAFDLAGNVTRQEA